MTRLAILRSLRAAILLGTSVMAAPPASALMIGPWEISLERLVSGFAVAGKQDSAAATQKTNAATTAARAAASSLVAAKQAIRVANAAHEYGFETGTGYSACTVNLQLADERASHDAAAVARTSQQRADDAWLIHGGDAGDRAGASLKLRQSFYCSPAQQQATEWCTGTGGYGAGDSNAGIFMLNRDYGAEEVMTAADYLDVIAPLPTIRTDTTSAEARARLVEARRRGAILSGARAAAWTVVLDGMGGSDKGE